MNLKRILTTLIGFPAITAIFILGNEYVIEWNNSDEGKESKVILNG